MKEPLFPEPLIERTTEPGPTESRVELLRTLTTDDAKLARANINAWFEMLPERARMSMASRLTSRNSQEQIQATDELYVFSELRKVFSRVEVEEDIEGSNPDFRAYKDDELACTIEVRSLFNAGEITDLNSRFNGLAEKLNAAFPSAPYVV